MVSIGSLFHSFRDLGDGLALQRKKLRVLHHAHQNGFRAGISCHSLSHSVEGVSISLRMRARSGGIFQALDQLGVAAIMRPGRNKGGKRVEPGRDRRKCWR